MHLMTRILKDSIGLRIPKHAVLFYGPAVPHQAGRTSGGVFGYARITEYGNIYRFGLQFGLLVL